MGVLDEIKDFGVRLAERVPNLLILLSFISFLGGFVRFKNGFTFPSESPKYFFIIIGFCLLTLGLVMNYFGSEKRTRKIKDKTQLKLNSCTLTIRILPIQKAKNLTSGSAFVLPANNTFADDCVTDGNSALGAFFKEHHSDKIVGFKENIKTILNHQNIQPVQNDLYKPATALILPDEYSIKAKVILVASSVRNDGQGFHTNPTIISDSIQTVFEKTCDKRISTLYLPIIGSGHAGLDATEALNLMLLFIKFHTKRFHHIKNITIFILENDRKKIKANFLNSLI